MKLLHPDKLTEDPIRHKMKEASKGFVIQEKIKIRYFVMQEF